MNKAAMSFSEMPQFLMAVAGAVGAAVLSKYQDVPLAYLLAVACVLVACRSTGTVTLTPHFIARRTLWSDHKMAWGEVEYLEIGFGCSRFVFHGRGKRLSMPAPRSFSGEEDSDWPSAYIEELALERGIPVESNWLATFKFSRGV